MKALPGRAQLYIALTALIAAMVLAASLAYLMETPEQWPTVLLFAGLICLADLFPIVMPFPGDAEMTVSGALKVAVVILFGPAAVVWATFLGTLVAESILRRAWYKAAFNVSQMVVTFGALGLVYQILYDGNLDPLHSIRNILAVLAVALVYYVLNTGLVAGVIALANRIAASYVWRTSYRNVAWPELTMIPLGVMIAILWESSPWTIVLATLPLLVVRMSLIQASVLQLQTTETLLALADTIDQRDPTTYQHSQRVAVFAEIIAKEMQLPQDQIESISMAARLHDVGKIGMSNSLLYKPDRFSLDEWQEFRRHPIIGSNMVENFPLFRQGRDLILYHHERWDGQGYPSRLAGEEIPVGARIIAAADALEAMTSDRVYRKALSLDEAMVEFRKERGYQFAPDVVDALLVALERQRKQSPEWEVETFRRRVRTYPVMQPVPDQMSG